MAGSPNDVDAGIVTITSRSTVSDTVARLSDLAAARGMDIFAVIDHSGEARRVGLELRETKLVIFGSPTAGTPVMVASPLAALDLPLKVLVWDDDGQTKLSYTAPGTLATRHHLSDAMGQRLSGISSIVDAVSRGNGSSQEE